jgi:hypothetical protein
MISEEDIMSIVIEPSEFLGIYIGLNNLPKSDRNFEGRTLYMIKEFPGQPELGMSVEYRLIAMAEEIDAGALPGWVTEKQPDGSLFVSEPVLRAAATEPLFFEGNNPRFNRENFVKSILLISEPEGTG